MNLYGFYIKLIADEGVTEGNIAGEVGRCIMEKLELGQEYSVKMVRESNPDGKYQLGLYIKQIGEKLNATNA